VKIFFHDDALEEYVAAVTWYERDYPGRGERFGAAVEQALAGIAGGPQAFPRRFGVHAVPVPRFPYVVFFDVPDPDSIRVLAVAHGKRRPGYWRDRG
jgi:plasmid stabilization system protein ParE